MAKESFNIKKSTFTEVWIEDEKEADEVLWVECFVVRMCNVKFEEEREG